MSESLRASHRERLESVQPVPAKAVLKPVETRGDLTLEQAELLAGAIVTAVLDDTKAALKEYGAPAQVWRWKQGEENPNLARLLQKVEARKAMARAILRSVPRVRERVVFEIEEAS